MRALVIAAAVVACSAESVDPAPRAAAGGATSAGAGGTIEPAAVVRTVSVRSPWGMPPDNLLVDGDFEMAIGLEGGEQPSGWVALDSGTNAPKYLRGETGGLCKSGLRCGVLPAGTLLLARGAAAAGVPMSASLWAKPPAGRGCDAVHAELLRCDGAFATTTLKSVAAAPAADGWCYYAAAVPPYDAKICLLVDGKLSGKETALIDAATLLPAPKASGLALEPLAADRREQVRRATRRLRDLGRFGAAVPRTEKPD